VNQVSSWCDNVTIVSSTLAGIASVGASSGHVSQISCLSIGSIGGVLYLIGTYGMERLRLDDPLQSTQTHLLCGFWGVIAWACLIWKKESSRRGNST
jgi:ammonia channel protein AmtB